MMDTRWIGYSLPYLFDPLLATSALLLLNFFVILLIAMWNDTPLFVA